MFAPARSAMFATANKQTCDFGMPKSVFLVTSCRAARSDAKHRHTERAQQGEAVEEAV